MTCLILLLACAGSANAAQASGATEKRIPGAKVSSDDGFVFDANSVGDYVIAWSPDGGDSYTRVLRGSAATGAQRTWRLKTGHSSTPDVAISSSGTMAVAWTEATSGPNSYYRRKYGAIWHAADGKINPHLLASSRTEVAQDLGAVDVSINSAGTAAFAWQTAFPTERISVAIGRPDGTFTPSRRIFRNDRPGFLGDPKVSIDDAGRTAVRWGDLGVNCKEDFFVPKACKNRASALLYTQGSADFQFTPISRTGNRCGWGDGDSNGLGQNVYLVACESGYHYTTSDNGQPFSGLRELQMFGGKHGPYDPDVKLLEDGTVFVAYETLRFEKKGGPYSRTVASRGSFGAPLGSPSAITPEVDHRDAEAFGGFYTNGPVVLEGPGSQIYIARTDFDSGMIGAIGGSGQVGPEIALANGQATRLAIAPGGVGLSVFVREKVSRNKTRAQLWTSTFPLPTP